MSLDGCNQSRRTREHAQFATTHWSVVLAADHSETARSAQALEELCRNYWHPLFTHARRFGHSPAEAEDLIQAFFAHFLDKQYVRAARRVRGRFRSFLLTSLRHFITQEWRKSQTARHGGQKAMIAWHESVARNLNVADTAGLTPAEVYDQRWALTLCERALDRLREEFVEKGKANEYEPLKQFLSNEGGESAYSAVASQLGLTPGAVAVAVHRLRLRYGELVRKEIMHTVTSPGEVEEELRYLLSLLSR